MKPLTSSVLFTNYYNRDVQSVIKTIFPDNFDLLFIEKAGVEQIVERIPYADYLVVGGRTKIDYQILVRAHRLKMIQRTGVGLDSLDLNYIKESGIPVYLNKGVNSLSVAEHCMMLTLACLKSLKTSDESLRSGKWLKHTIGLKNRELTGKVIGLIGMGSIAKKFIHLLKPYNVKIFYFKPEKLNRSEEEKIGIEYLTLNDLLKVSDVVSIHCPLLPETLNLLSDNEFSAMKKDVILINTARGGIIDQKALIRKLKRDIESTAGLDVFEEEPIDSSDEILSLPNVMLTPHIGGVTLDSFKNMMTGAFENIHAFSNGNIEMLESKRLI